MEAEVVHQGPVVPVQPAVERRTPPEAHRHQVVAHPWRRRATRDSSHPRHRPTPAAAARVFRLREQVRRPFSAVATPVQRGGARGAGKRRRRGLGSGGGQRRFRRYETDPDRASRPEGVPLRRREEERERRGRGRPARGRRRRGILRAGGAPARRARAPVGGPDVKNVGSSGEPQSLSREYNMEPRGALTGGSSRPGAPQSDGRARGSEAGEDQSRGAGAGRTGAGSAVPKAGHPALSRAAPGRPRPGDRRCGDPCRAPPVRPGHRSLPHVRSARGTRSPFGPRP